MKSRIERDRHFDCTPARCVAPPARLRGAQQPGRCVPRKTWWLRTRDGAGKRVSLALRTEDEARVAAAKVDAARTLGVDYQPKVVTPAAPTFAQVAVDPFHPDFRVRGVSIATSKDRGAWIELGGLPSRLTAEMRHGLEALKAAFGSDAGKGAYNGSFDENGLVYTGWVPQVRNRTRDGMLMMIALGDGTHESLRLEHAVRVLLHHDYEWDDVDKSLMRDLPIEIVAKGAVRDACYTHELCDLLEERSVSETPYIKWSKLNQAPLQSEGDVNGQEVEPDEYLSGA